MARARGEGRAGSFPPATRHHLAVLEAPVGQVLICLLDARLWLPLPLPRNTAHSPRLLPQGPSTAWHSVRTPHIQGDSVQELQGLNPPVFSSPATTASRPFWNDEATAVPVPSPAVSQTVSGRGRQKQQDMATGEGPLRVPSLPWEDGGGSFPEIPQVGWQPTRQTFPAHEALGEIWDTGPPLQRKALHLGRG